MAVLKGGTYVGGDLTVATNLNVGGSVYGQITASDNTAAKALLSSGAGRPDNSTGDTWIFLDAAGGTANPWGIQHDQTNNRINFYGAGTVKSYISLSDGTYSGNATTATTASTCSGNAATATYAANSSKLYSTDTTYQYGGGNPYYGYLTYDGSRWLFQVSPASPAAVRVSYADTAGSATSSTNVYQDTDPASGTYRILLGNATDANGAVYNKSALYWNDTGSIIQGANISGNAATATYTSRLHRLDDTNNYYLSHYWTGAYWYLRGYDPSDNFHAEVQVGYAISAGTSGACSGNAATATKLAASRTIAGVSFDGSADISIPFANLSSIPTTLSGYGITDAASSSHTHSDLSNATSSNAANTLVKRDSSGNFSAGTITATLSGNASTASRTVATVTGTNSVELVRGNMADNDQFRILVGGTASNAGYVEIATADDGTEPIYVRQYTGDFSTIARTATLLDASGNTTFPGSLTANLVYNAVWNDIADFLEVPETTEIEFGKVYTRINAQVVQTFKKGQKAIGISSDTYGFGVGKKEIGKELPIAIGGWVLAHVDHIYSFGTELIATKKGVLTKAPLWIKLFCPSRILAIFDRPEIGAEWNGIKVDGRHWVKVI